MGDSIQAPAGQLTPAEQELLDAAGGTIDSTKLDPAAQGQKGEAPAQTKQPVVDPAAQAPVQPAGNQPAQQQPGAGGEQSPQPIKVVTPLGTMEFGATGGPVLSSFEDVQAFAKERGVEMKTVDDIRQLFSAIADLKQKADTLPQLESAVNNYRNTLNTLPPEVLNLVEAAAGGKDYKSLIKDLAAGVEIDLTRNFSEHNPLTLVRQYVDPGFNQETYDALDDANKRAIDTLAKTSYNNAKVGWEKAVADNKVAQDNYNQSMNTSMQVAIDNLKAKYPGMGDGALKKVADTMQYGFKDSLFNPDNTWKPDAGIKIAMQEFGEEAVATQKETLSDFYAKMAGKIQSTVHEQLLGRSDTPDQQGRQVADQTNVIADTVKQATSFINAK